MFANSFQSGFISVFYSVGTNPLSLWDKSVKNGHIRRVVDDEVKSLVLEISGTNVATTYITCPIKPRASLGIRLPFLVMVIKNMKKYFTFEIQILDDKDMHRRFRVSNFQSTTKVRPFCTTMPIGLSSGWNQIQFNLADFTKRAYGSTYVETMRVQIHANVRIRRIYFSDRLYADEEMPNEFKLFVPIPGGQKRGSIDAKKDSKEAAAAPPAGQKGKQVPPPTQENAEAEKPETVVQKIDLEDAEAPGAPPTPVELETPVASPEAAEAQQEEQAAEEKPPAEGEEAVAPEEQVVGEGEEPPKDEAAPEGEAPAEEGETPAGEEAPAGEGETPAGEGETPIGEGDAPAEEGGAAAEEGEAAAPKESEEATEASEAPPESPNAAPEETTESPTETEAPAVTETETEATTEEVSDV